MTTTQDAAIIALGEAIKFESDGREFYLRAAERTNNSLAKSVFLALAEDEKDHIRRVREIYEELKDKPDWPAVPVMVARQSGVLGVFEREVVHLQNRVGITSDATEALETAAELERQGLAFYRERSAKASCQAEAAFYEQLIKEEELHLHAIQRVMEQLA